MEAGTGDRAGIFLRHCSDTEYSWLQMGSGLSTMEHLPHTCIGAHKLWRSYLLAFRKHFGPAVGGFLSLTDPGCSGSGWEGLEGDGTGGKVALLVVWPACKLDRKGGG